MNSIKVTKEAVYSALDGLEDPELGIAVTDLGMVHAVHVEGSHVTVEMLLTSEFCPMAETILEGAKAIVEAVPGVEQADVSLATDVVWDPSRIVRGVWD